MICGEPMRKNGTTSSGRQRWRCMRCRASSAGDGGNARASAEFRAFPVWVTGRMTLAQAAAMLGVSPRTFIRRIQWCWHARPEIPRPTSPCHAVEADAADVPYGWCPLVAVDAADGTPVAFQWCDTGGRAAYTRLFPRPPAPRARHRRGRRMRRGRRRHVERHKNPTVPRARAAQHAHGPHLQATHRRGQRPAQARRETREGPRRRRRRGPAQPAQRLAHPLRRHHRPTHHRTQTTPATPKPAPDAHGGGPTPG
jgi:hypothetical protein